MNLASMIRQGAAIFGVYLGRVRHQPETTVMGLVGQPIDLVIDVGANQAQFATEMRRKFPRAHIVSFEPNPPVFAKVEAWARRDGNATALNLGIGDQDAVLEMFIHLDHTASSSMLRTTAQEEAMFPLTRLQERREVQVRRLDDVLAEIGRPAGPTTFLKLDIQGFEEKAMRGAPNTLAAVRALLTEVAVDPLYEGQPDFLSLVQHAAAGGLRYAGNYSQTPAADGHVMWLDALFIR